MIPEIGTPHSAPTPAPMRFIHPDDMPDVYALTGVGSCMEPIVNDGAVIVFDKREAPQRGDVVGLVFTPEYARIYGMPGCIKRLSLALPPPVAFKFKGAAPVIAVEQISPARSYTFASSDVLAVHKCVGIAEPVGPGKARWNPKQGAPR